MIKGDITLMIGDVVAASSAFFLASVLAYGSGLMLTEAISETGTLMTVMVQVLTLTVAGLHARGKAYSDREFAARMALAFMSGIILLLSLRVMLSIMSYGYGFAVSFVCLALLFQFVWRTWQRSGRGYRAFAKKILVLGTGPLARQIGNIISDTRNNVLGGYINCASEPISVPSYSVVGREEGLIEAIKREKADKLVVSLSERRGVFPLRNVLDCKLKGIEVVDAPSFYEEATGKLFLENITPGWFIFSRGFRLTRLMRAIKRLMDIFCASLGMALFAPLFPLVAAVIKLDSRGPLFFKQVRVGQGERNFTVYKFRTMVADAEVKTGAVWAQEKDPRVTKVGDFLRKSRIDEVPQLFNVLRGDMSFVGPRPERPEFVADLKKVIPFYSERHFFKPGVTGWAQVCYPYGASVEDAIEKLRYDLYYIKNFSLIFDIRIILKTVKVVLMRQGGR